LCNTNTVVSVIGVISNNKEDQSVSK